MVHREVTLPNIIRPKRERGKNMNFNFNSFYNFIESNKPSNDVCILVTIRTGFISARSNGKRMFFQVTIFCKQKNKNV